MSEFNLQLKMLEKVANALGDELLPQVVFVGGCTTGLLITDEFTKEQVRYTEDVDLIVHIISRPDWPRLQKKLRQQGFQDDVNENTVICRMQLDGVLKVDFMPDDPNILGFSNRWYPQAMETAQLYQLNDDTQISLIQPEFFVGTKLEAYKGRGNNDALSSHDIEDLLNVFDGRPSIIEEIQASLPELKTYISEELRILLEDSNFEYAVQSACKNDSNRETLIFERLQACVFHD